MVQRISLCIVSAFVSLSLASPALAQIAPCTTSPCYDGSFQSGIDAAQQALPLQSNLSISEIILRIIGIILDVILIIAVLAIIIAGVYLIVSNGDEGQKDKAKKIVTYVAAGILLILFSRAIVVFLNNMFG